MDTQPVPSVTSPPQAFCPSCGAAVNSDAASCLVCGRPLANSPMPPSADSAPSAPAPDAGAVASTASRFQPEPEPAPPAAATTAVEAFSATETEHPSKTGQPAPASGLIAIERVCEWCGAANTAGAERCVRCNAHFPRPEQDALLTRASQERLRLALGEIEMHERMRTPWWKKLFPEKKEEAR